MGGTVLSNNYVLDGKDNSILFVSAKEVVDVYKIFWEYGLVILDLVSQAYRASISFADGFPMWNESQNKTEANFKIFGNPTL